MAPDHVRCPTTTVCARVHRLFGYALALLHPDTLRQPGMRLVQDTLQAHALHLLLNFSVAFHVAFYDASRDCTFTLASVTLTRTGNSMREKSRSSPSPGHPVWW